MDPRVWSTDNQLFMVLPSDVTLLEDAVDAWSGFFGERLEDDDLTFRLVLLLSEAVTNGMEHGNKLDPAKEVNVVCEVRDHEVEVSVEDQGEGFDLSVLTNPLEEEHLLDSGGRGVFLIDTMADRVTYENGGRLVRMVFDRNTK